MASVVPLFRTVPSIVSAANLPTRRTIIQCIDLNQIVGIDGVSMIVPDHDDEKLPGADIFVTKLVAISEIPAMVPIANAFVFEFPAVYPHGDSGPVLDLVSLAIECGIVVNLWFVPDHDLVPVYKDTTGDGVESNLPM